ncbi:MAG TPA: GNAT family N-acetyltransferase [Streptosporangiaceae bacterium]
MRDVRLAALADAPDAFASTLAGERGQPEAEWRARIAALPWFLGFQDGQPAGLIAALPPRPRPDQAPAQDPDQAQQHDPDQDPEQTWHLVSMWVSPDARGAGLAELLVAAVTEHARQAGADRVTLWVAVGNERARRFYRRLAFTPTGRRQQYPRPGAADLDEEELGCMLSPDPQRHP